MLICKLCCIKICWEFPVFLMLLRISSFTKTISINVITQYGLRGIVYLSQYYHPDTFYRTWFYLKPWSSKFSLNPTFSFKSQLLNFKCNSDCPLLSPLHPNPTWKLFRAYVTMSYPSRVWVWNRNLILLA